MNDPIFLTLDQVLRIHAYQIEHFGGSAAVLDLAKVESAIAQPRQGFAGQYVHEDLPAMAAAYLFHLVQNHGFEDGNKRTGTHAAIVFLELNGCEIDLPVGETEALVLAVAAGTKKKEDVIRFFRIRLSGT